MNQEHYLLEWRGVQQGPWTLDEIEHRLSEGDIHSMHKIQVDGRWLVLREFLEGHRQKVRRAAAAEKAVVAPSPSLFAEALPPPVIHQAAYLDPESTSAPQESRYRERVQKPGSAATTLILGGVIFAILIAITVFFFTKSGQHDAKLTKSVAETPVAPKVPVSSTPEPPAQQVVANNNGGTGRGGGGTGAGGAGAASGPPAALMELPASAPEQTRTEPRPPYVAEPVGKVSVMAPGAELTTEQIAESKTPFVVPLKFFFTYKDKSGKTQEEGSAGSGVYINDEGNYSIFITNRHVVDLPEEAETYEGMMEFRGEEVSFEIIAYARYTVDLAKIRIKKNGAAVPPVDMVMMADLKPGQECVAIGNALGGGISVTTGVISAFDEIESVKYIRTSAPISSGNSGGGLFRKKDGRLVGITTLASRGGSKKEAIQNINHAIPVDYILSDLFWDKRSK